MVALYLDSPMLAAGFLPHCPSAAQQRAESGKQGPATGDAMVPSLTADRLGKRTSRLVGQFIQALIESGANRIPSGMSKSHLQLR